MHHGKAKAVSSMAQFAAHAESPAQANMRPPRRTRGAETFFAMPYARDASNAVCYGSAAGARAADRQDISGRYGASMYY